MNPLRPIRQAMVPALMGMTPVPVVPVEVPVRPGRVQVEGHTIQVSEELPALMFPVTKVDLLKYRMNIQARKTGETISGLPIYETGRCHAHPSGVRFTIRELRARPGAAPWVIIEPPTEWTPKQK